MSNCPVLRNFRSKPKSSSWNWNSCVLSWINWCEEHETRTADSVVKFPRPANAPLVMDAIWLLSRYLHGAQSVSGIRGTLINRCYNVLKLHNPVKAPLETNEILFTLRTLKTKVLNQSMPNHQQETKLTGSSTYPIPRSCRLQSMWSCSQISD